jgi:formamidopyrimidine-DNA glycosylase
MPELPEVETVVRGLRGAVLGRSIVSVRLGKTDFMDDAEAIEEGLPGRRIAAVERCGKFIVVRLGEERGGASAGALLVHLGMTGHLAAWAAEQPERKHTHAWFALDDGREIRYTDARRFGRMAMMTEEELARELGPLGAEPLEVSEEEFFLRIGSRRARIKALLLDQRVLRGVGNIYADESLWRARIHPERIGARLSAKEAAGLRRALREILLRAIALRGSSIADFVDAEGAPGEYQRRHKAYGREGQECARCGTMIRRIVVAGRSSFFCPKCQRAPRGRRKGAAKRLRKKKR